MLKRIAAVALLIEGLAGCATGGAFSYLHDEYAGAQADGTTDMGTSDAPELWRVWVHKAKPKMVVEPPLSAALGTGFVKGVTFGGANAAPVEPTFEKAALKYLAETKGEGCRVSKPVMLHDLIWEFDYSCSQDKFNAPSVPRRPQR